LSRRRRQRSWARQQGSSRAVLPFQTPNRPPPYSPYPIGIPVLSLNSFPYLRRKVYVSCVSVVRFLSYLSVAILLFTSCCSSPHIPSALPTHTFPSVPSNQRCRLPARWAAQWVSLQQRSLLGGDSRCCWASPRGSIAPSSDAPKPTPTAAKRSPSLWAGSPAVAHYTIPPPSQSVAWHIRTMVIPLSPCFGGGSPQLQGTASGPPLTFRCYGPPGGWVRPDPFLPLFLLLLLCVCCETRSCRHAPALRS
jgi:hypothetical protein